MEQDLEKQVQERFATLPPVVQQAIQSSDFEQRLQKIGATHSLHIDQVGEVQDEVMLVMLGFADPAEFAGRLQTHVHLSPEQAKKVAEQIGAEIFMPIRSAMQEFMENESAAEDAALIARTVQAGPATTPVRQEPPASKPTTPTPPASVPPFAAPKTPPPAPGSYTTDPYREPPV